MDQNEKEVLARLDERTKRIDSKLDRAMKETQSNREDVDELQDKVRRNTTILTGVASGVTAVVLWLSDKVTRLI